MKCQKCQSERVVEIFAHSSDCNNVTFNKIEKQGYLPNIPGICGGDDLEIQLCLECGQVQGSFPKPDPEGFEEDEEDETENSSINDYAEEWSDAYRGDHCGRKVSIEIIDAMFDYGMSPKAAEEVYRSKHLRWFFDGQGDRVAANKAKALFTEYLEDNSNGVQEMIEEYS